MSESNPRDTLLDMTAKAAAESFKGMQKEVIKEMRRQIDSLELVTNALPPLPFQAAYVSVNHFPYANFAGAVLRLSVLERDNVRPLLDIFEPKRFFYNSQTQPAFLPEHIAASDSAAREVFPVVHTAWLEIDAGGSEIRNVAQASWYAEIAGINVMVITQIINDEATVSAHSANGLPFGGHQHPDNGVQDGMRSITTFWELEDDGYGFDAWNQDFSSGLSDEWAEFIEVDEND